MTTPNLDGHRAVALNTCFDCKGPLRDEEGRFSERIVSVSGTSAFAAAICCKCKSERKLKEENICGKPMAGEPEYICTLEPKHRGHCIYEEVG